MVHSIIDQLFLLHTINNKNNWIIIANNDLNEIDAQWFTQDFWMNQGRLLGANSGRGSAWVIKSEWGKWVLRHYFRGGLYAKISRDSYFWTGLKKSRAYQEFILLEHLQTLNLPSPKPIAAQITKKGLFYKNDIIMSHIHHDHTFAELISKNKEFLNETWASIGSTIANFHCHGIYHSDLNAHNILIKNSNEVFIIDFDKGKMRTPQKSWRVENLNRLKRSIEKVTGMNCHDELKTPWQILLDAYLETFR